MDIKVLEPKDPILRTPCQPISPKELKSKEFQELVEGMLDFVYGANNKGSDHSRKKPMTVGLSANQVGISKRISIVDLAIGKRNFNDIHCLINPEIIWSSKQTKESLEGCVNLPSTWGFITRSQRVKVKALDRSGNKLELDLVGWPAILLQHEIGHLNGELFIDKLADPKKALLVESGDYKEFKKLKKKWNKFRDVSSLISQD